MEKTATRHQEKKQGGLAYAAKAVAAFTLITTGTMLLLASCGDSDLPLGQHIATAFGLLAASAACFAAVAFPPLKSILKD